MNRYTVLLLSTVFEILLLSSCIPFRAVIHGRPDKKDIHRFSKAVIDAPRDNCFEFTEAKSLGEQLKISDWSRDIPFFMRLDSFVELHQLRSFIVIQNDSIKFEYYGDQYDQEELHTSYSIAKSFLAILTGIAIEEGEIESEEELVVNYIPEIAHLDYANTLKIEHLLNHTSGLEYQIVVDAKIYYGNDILKALKRLKFEHPPGKVQHYLNVNSQLLGIVLKRAIDRPLSDYLKEKILTPIKICNEVHWLRDKKNKLERSFCCMGLTALDYAKFGRLMLHKGKWGSLQIIPQDWYEKSLQRDTSNGSSFNYNYSWHIGLKEYEDFMAIGLYKQHIYVCPKKKIIIVSLANRMKPLKAERMNWWFVFRQIVDQL
jgi:CubicO group peptidase (beta-lactamase class C family)